MANKKAGSRAAAGQAKARERARRRARAGGPSIASAAYEPPVEDDRADQPESAADPDAAPAAADAPYPAQRSALQTVPPSRAASPSRTTSPSRDAAPVRRERAASLMTPAGSLKRELALIFSITALIAAALAALEATNALGA